jgi:hypothetical protein
MGPPHFLQLIANDLPGLAVDAVILSGYEIAHLIALAL